MWVSRSALLLLSVAMTACDEPAPAPRGQAGPSLDTRQPGVTPERQASEQVTSLAGDWRVAGIDGSPVDGPVALAMTGDEREIWWSPRCAGVVRSYRIQGTSVSFDPAGPTRPAGSPTPPVCTIGLPSRVPDVARALDDAASITRTPGNGVLISGPNHSVTLFSQ